MRSLVVSACLLASLLVPSLAVAAENYVYLRLNPVAFAVHGTPMFPGPGGGGSGWYPDLFGVGFSYKKLDVSFHMTAQKPFPETGDFSVMYGRLSAAVRPLKSGQQSMVDPYLFAGGGFGGAGWYGKRDAACVSTPAETCPEGRSGWGGGLHGGIGLDFTWPLTTIATTGQKLSAFVGLELRAELFYAERVNLFTVYSLPFGIRLD